MKHQFTTPLLIFFLLFTLNNCCAQKRKAPIIEIPEFIIDGETKKVIYQEVVEQKGSKDVLYDKALAWATKHYKNPTNVLREKDKLNGKIKAKARFYIYYTDPKKGTKTRTHTIEYLFTIQIKKNRYRYVITDIIYKTTSYQGIEQWIDANNKQYDYAMASYLVQIDEEINKLTDLFKSAIAKEEKATDTW